MYLPLFESDACSYATGEAGQLRRHVYDTAFSHEACGRYLAEFQKVISYRNGVDVIMIVSLSIYRFMTFDACVVVF